MKLKKSKLILTEEEKICLLKASNILNKIGTLMDRATSVDWSIYDDEEIFDAVEIMESFLDD